MIFVEFKMQQDMFLQIKLRKTEQITYLEANKQQTR